MNQYDLVIIGSGPAGMTAAIYGARADLKVLMLDKLAPGGQIINTNEIQNYTGVGTINGAELAMNMFNHTQELNVEFDYGTVCKIDADGDVPDLLQHGLRVHAVSAVSLFRILVHVSLLDCPDIE